MGNPASHTEFRHTCPSCNRPVRPGYKFCEVCGTRIPSLVTCSKCGTQFVHPKKFCDLCGTPFIVDEIPETDIEGIPEPADEETAEQYDSEIQGLYSGDLRETEAEEIPEPDEEELPEHYDSEIPEPDTGELLEQYGKEYGDDETLDSYHRQKSVSPVNPEAKKSAAVPALHQRDSPETVDDVLFLPDKEPVPAKRPVTRIKTVGGGIVLITILAVVIFFGLPMLTANEIFRANSSPAAEDITPVPEPTAAATTPPTLAAPSSRAFVPLPTQLVPGSQNFAFHVQKNPITSKISVIFTGSSGDEGISTADIRVTHSDGSVAMGVILPLKGVNEITLDGSKETDRVEIIVKMSSGKTYRVYDELVPLMR
jgi:hypothetical protein